MDLHSQFTPELIEEIKNQGPKTVDVTVEVNGERLVIGEAIIDHTDGGVDGTMQITDERFQALFGADPRAFHFQTGE